VETSRVISHEVHVNFKKTVDLQGEQHTQVSEALEAVKARTKKIVKESVANMLVEVTAQLEEVLGGEKQKICGLLHTNLTSTTDLCEYLYTCKVAYQLHYILTSHPHSAPKYAPRDI